VGEDVPASFEREQSFSEADWVRTLPGAVRSHALAFPRPGAAVATLGSGTLTLSWRMLPPRSMGLVRLPRMAVHYRFDGVDAATRAAFMRYFDLYTQRGGG